MKFYSILVAGLVTLSACNGGGTEGEENAADSTASEQAVGATTLPSGVQVDIQQAGDGVLPQVGQKVTVHYRGMLEDGTVFDESYKRNEPFTFQIGRGQVIPGWDQGIAQLSKGAKATITVPAEMGYGASGAGGVIPPNATLTFDVEVLDIQDGPQPIPHELWSTEGIEKQTTNSGLEYYIIEEGTGEPAVAGKMVSVHYYGALEDGTNFDSSFERGEPIEFQLGAGRVIPGWEEGISLLKEGAKAQFVIPSHLAYGERGAGNVIPANATLIFDVQLLDVK